MGSDKYKLSLFLDVEDTPRVILYFNTMTEVRLVKTILDSGWHMPKKWKLETYDEHESVWLDMNMNMLFH